MELTDQNYYSLEAGREYMSYSQYKSFVQCEGATMAGLRGEYSSLGSRPMFLGSYTHAWSEGEEAFEAFQIANESEIKQKNGKKYADILTCDAMIESLKSDPFCMHMLSGSKEVIVTAHFAGALWKAKMDVINDEFKRIVDLKTAQALNKKEWSDSQRCYVSFIEQYGYVGQMAVYSELHRLWAGNRATHGRTASEMRYDPYLVVVTKEDPPDKAIIEFDDASLEQELETVKGWMMRINQVKAGEIPPHACGKCAYCRSVKDTKVMHFRDLIYL
jgi:hypothetical protein